MKYIKQLDTIRALAVIMVIIHHWMTYSILNRYFPNGELGVDMFFVLSGFLITKILIDNRGKPHAVKNFYVRRVLRIFPIYYLTIMVLYFIGSRTGTDILTAFPYYLSYTQNFYFYFKNGWDGMLSHLWSLAAEEQFYIIWPWVILFVKQKYLLAVIIFFIIIGIVAESIFMPGMGTRLTVSCFDAFGLGGLLAWLITYKPKYSKKFFSFVCVCALISVSIFVAYRAGWLKIIPGRIVMALISLWLISYVVIYRDNLKCKFFFNNKFLIFLGKISYGLYIYHLILPPLLNDQLINVYFNPLLPDFKKYSIYLILVENTVILIGFSWLSFVVIEKPILNLKRYFNYSAKIRVAKPVFAD